MFQNGRWIGPILDQHMHLDRKNRFFEAVNEFIISGGTAINLVHKPDFSNLPKTPSDYRKAYQNTLEMATEVRNKFGITVSVILGPHPVAWEHQIHTMGLEKSSSLHLQAVKIALEYISSGHAICLGEVGRPHYPVSDEIWDASNDLLLKIMKLAAEAKTSIQLHVEDNGEKTYSDLAILCDKAKLSRHLAIRHYAPANISEEFTHGLSVTVSVGKDSISKIVETLPMSNSYWGMETDFLDDEKRPGAVLGPKTIPKRTQQLSSLLIKNGYSEGQVSEILNNIHFNWPQILYSIK
ncbi:TatD family hydrolase [Candidatus Poseidoniales archaeon]|jgi:TatD-related deoxyribonuclease|nr:TatD family hydrolase [Candidatus Poseidoniales archaeon]MDG1543297.1 TatD family hydrolase [Candidatus Thalassarchaeaceae archaeon]